MGRLLRTLALVVSVAGLALVALLYLAPRLLFGAVPSLARFVRSLDPSLVVVGAGLLLALLGMLRWFASRLFGSRASPAEPESTAAQQALYGTGGDLATLGAGFQARSETATTYEGTDEATRRAAREELVNSLREVATAAVVQATGAATADGRAAVERGEWTDDRRAAGLLADEEGPSVPTHLWLLDLLLGRDPFVEGVEHAVAAVAAQNGDERYLEGDTTARSHRTENKEQGVAGR